MKELTLERSRILFRREWADFLRNSTQIQDNQKKKHLKQN